ncbi:MAG: hypothetical protein FJ045_05250 [Crenarchaeota archaeon]|nr:hypothetical protein [Thermoproteota archaeon]
MHQRDRLIGEPAKVMASSCYEEARAHLDSNSRPYFHSPVGEQEQAEQMLEGISMQGVHSFQGKYSDRIGLAQCTALLSLPTSNP